MADVFNKAKRSEVMSRIRGKGNKNTELALLRLMRASGITGWRRHQPVFGNPDFVFPSERVAVFVDGCFWHGCPRHRQYPATNGAFWRKKLDANTKRDLLVARTLKNKGWTVVRIWECQLKKSPARCVARIKKAVNQPRVKKWKSGGGSRG
jgi:DNA mismatch endonuclease (patch repair protein)